MIAPAVGKDSVMHESSPDERIAVVGLGKLGSPIAACLAAAGYTVLGADTDPAKVEAINSGRAPVRETDLDAMIARSEGRLSATTEIDRAVEQADATLIMVPTPSDPDGRFSLRFVLAAVRAAGRALRGKRGYHIVSVCSTVMPGATGGEIREALELASGRRVGETLGLCYSPEFIALGSVIRDYLHPDMVLIGESDRRAGDALERIYRTVCRNEPVVQRMSFINAELTKIAVNSYITTKITFANMIAGICQHLPGADVDVVTGALGCDSRIGRKYLKGAVGYGGPCFPRDNVALARAADLAAAGADLARTVDQVNRQEVRRLADLVRTHLTDSQHTVGVLGLSYKPHTDVIEQSQGLLLTQLLASEGVPVIAHDPAAVENARGVLGDDVRFAATLEACVEAADVLVIATPWPQYAGLTLSMLSGAGRRRRVIDCWRCIEDPVLHESADYIAIGLGPRETAAEVEIRVNAATLQVA